MKQQPDECGNTNKTISQIDSYFQQQTTGLLPTLTTDVEIDSSRQSVPSSTTTLGQQQVLSSSCLSSLASSAAAMPFPVVKSNQSQYHQAHQSQQHNPLSYSPCKHYHHQHQVCACEAIPSCCPPSYAKTPPPPFTPPGPYERLVVLPNTCNLPVASLSQAMPFSSRDQCNETSISNTNTTQQQHFQTKVEYVHELPHPVRQSICDLLGLFSKFAYLLFMFYLSFSLTPIDADNSWQELGGNYLKMDSVQLTLLSHALYRNSSPTKELLMKWDARNAKVIQLYTYLYKMKHFRALKHLQPFVSTKKQVMINDDHKDKLSKNIEKNDLVTDSVFKMSTSPGPSQPSYSLNLPDSAIMGQPYISSVFNNPQASVLSHQPEVSVQQKISPSNSNSNSRSSGSQSSGPKMNTAINVQQQQISQKQESQQVQQPPAPPPSLNIEPPESSLKLNLKKKDIEKKKQDYLVKMKDLEIPYQELAEASSNFAKENILGSGGFGTVFLGEWKGTKVAVKKLKGLDNVSQALTEMRILNFCRIDNILPFYGVSLDGPEPCLVYQYMPNGSLEDRLLCKNGSQPLTWSQRVSIAEGVARALHFLHTFKPENPFVHGDVKSANILLDSILEPKLGDFGLARQMMKNDGSNADATKLKTLLQTHCTVSSVNGTSVYLPPEYLRNKILSPAVDVYSYGVVVLEMATGRRAFDGKKLLVNMVEDEYARIMAEQQQHQVTQPNAGNKMNEAFDTTLDLLMDRRIAFMIKDRQWFNCLLELGRQCGNKTKSKRPTMKQVFKYF